MKYLSHNTEETDQFAYDFARKLKGGEIITLDGDLGAGKTAFVRGLARGLEITDTVSSPTFTIVNEYRHGRIPVFHFDVYRISSSEELYDIGWDDYVNANAVIVMEWACIVSDIFEEEPIRIQINKIPTLGEDIREITIEGEV